MKTVHIWTTVGAVLNTILSAIYGTLMILTGVGAAILWNSTGDIAETLNNIDSESYVAGYQAVAGVLGGLGLGFIFVIAIALFILFLVLFILALVPAILGFHWNKTHKAGDNPLWLIRPCYGNIIARLVLGSLSLIMACVFAVGGSRDGSILLWMAVVYQGIIVTSHIICLVRARKVCKQKEARNSIVR